MFEAIVIGLIMLGFASTGCSSKMVAKNCMRAQDTKGELSSWYVCDKDE